MTTLNKSAAEAINGFKANDRRPTTNDAPPVHALTDVTGFGLIGHLREMLLASENVSAEIHVGSIPLLEGALECARAGHIPAGLKANREFAECVVGYDDEVSDDMKTLLFDPQTAGGLLIAVSPEYADGLIQSLRDAGVSATEIGTILLGVKPLVSVKK
jgi:selenide,water dikinase